jgi:alpha-glucosidase
MLAFSRALLSWRRTQPLLRTGGIRFIDTPDPQLLHFERHGEGASSLQAIFNFGSEPASSPLPHGIAPVVGQPLAETSVIHTLDGKRMLQLAPYGVFFGAPAGEEPS